MAQKYVLAIESSCDDTAAAVLDFQGDVLSDVVFSQQDHVIWGGVVPEISSRQHLGRVASIVQQALDAAKVTPQNISAVAVTQGPGLIGSLLVGVQFAKGFAQTLQIPLIGIHHIEGHVLAGLHDEGFPKPPFIGLIASGGHSAIYLCNEGYQISMIGETRDDAAGEAFDKIGRLLGFSYPAGRKIDKLAEQGDETKFPLPVALKAHTTYDLSFSGLKTAARELIYKLEANQKPLDEQTVKDICASTRRAIVDALLGKAILACRQLQIYRLVLGGGVAANSLLRKEAKRVAPENEIQVYLPKQKHCTDNAVMIGHAALRRLHLGQTSSLNISPKAQMDFNH